MLYVNDVQYLKNFHIRWEYQWKTYNGTGMTSVISLYVNDIQLINSIYIRREYKRETYIMAVI